MSTKNIYIYIYMSVKENVYIYTHACIYGPPMNYKCFSARQFCYTFL